MEIHRHTKVSALHHAAAIGLVSVCVLSWKVLYSMTWGAVLDAFRLQNWLSTRGCWNPLGWDLNTVTELEASSDGATAIGLLVLCCGRHRGPRGSLVARPALFQASEAQRRGTSLS